VYVCVCVCVCVNRDNGILPVLPVEESVGYHLYTRDFDRTLGNTGISRYSQDQR